MKTATLAVLLAVSCSLFFLGMWGVDFAFNHRNVCIDTGEGCFIGVPVLHYISEDLRYWDVGDWWNINMAIAYVSEVFSVYFAIMLGTRLARMKPELHIYLTEKLGLRKHGKYR